DIRPRPPVAGHDRGPDALATLSPRFAAMYCTIGRPSIPHEQLLRALLLQALYTVRSEIAAAFFDAVVTQARDAGLRARSSRPKAQSPKPRAGRPPRYFVSGLLEPFGHADAHVHAAHGRRRTDEGAPERQRVALVPRDRHANEVAVADDVVGGVEVHPAGSGQIDLHPRVGGAAADDGAAGGIRHEDITADEPGGQATRSRRLHHQDREVPAAAAAPAQRVAGTLHPFLDAREIAAFVLDAARHRQQQPHRRVL